MSGCYWGERGSANGRRAAGPHDHPPPLPFIRAGLCCLFNSFICRNDCDYQSRAHRLTEEVKVAPQEDKPQKTILHVYMILRASDERYRGIPRVLESKQKSGGLESLLSRERRAPRDRERGRKNICA